MVFPIAFIGLLCVILVPLPTQVLDLLLVCNITLSVLVLVTTMYVKSPLEFSVFPSLLLAITLFPPGAQRGNDPVDPDRCGQHFCRR